MRTRAALLRTVAAAAGIAGLFWACTPAGKVRNEHFLEEAEKSFLLKDYAVAADHYETFLEDNPGHPDRAGILLLAGVCRSAGGRPGDGIGLFDRALAASPSRPLRWEIRFRRAVAYGMTGEPDRALRAFREVAVAPLSDRGERITNDELYYEYALACFRAGDWSTGHAQLARVSDAGPYGERKMLRAGLRAFAVQVGVFSSEGRARTQAARLKPHTSKAKITSVAGEASRFVVRAGPFARYADAAREADRLKRLGFPDAFVVP